MLRSHRRHTSLIRQLILLTALPLALAGTGYALFTKSLTWNTTTAKPYYSSTQYLYASYTKTETANGSNTNYSLSTTILNKGATSVTAWQYKFDVPSNVATVTCQSTVTCSKSGVTVTVVNGAGNGTIAAGASTSAFSITFTSATAKYVLQNNYVSGTFSTAYQTIAGLTISPVRGTPVKNGGNFNIPYTFTVTNNTAQSLSAWQAVCTWATQPISSTVDATVTFVSATANGTFTSKTAIGSLSSFVFNGTFVLKSQTWTISGCTIQGKA